MTDAPDRDEARVGESGDPPCKHQLEIEARARQYLETLGYGHHHEAPADPVYALFQVAADCCAQANGWRELYERLKNGREHAGEGPRTAASPWPGAGRAPPACEDRVHAPRPNPSDPPVSVGDRP